MLLIDNKPCNLGPPDAFECRANLYFYPASDEAIIINDNHDCVRWLESYLADAINERARIAGIAKLICKLCGDVGIFDLDRSYAHAKLLRLHVIR